MSCNCLTFYCDWLYGLGMCCYCQHACLIMINSLCWANIGRHHKPLAAGIVNTISKFKWWASSTGYFCNFCCIYLVWNKQFMQVYSTHLVACMLCTYICNDYRYWHLFNQLDLKSYFILVHDKFLVSVNNVGMGYDHPDYFLEAVSDKVSITILIFIRKVTYFIMIILSC